MNVQNYLNNIISLAHQARHEQDPVNLFSILECMLGDLESAHKEVLASLEAEHGKNAPLDTMTQEELNADNARRDGWKK